MSFEGTVTKREVGEVSCPKTHVVLRPGQSVCSCGEVTYGAPRFAAGADEERNKMPHIRSLDEYHEIFVAPWGHDTNPGTKDYPLRTFEQATRLLHQNPGAQITVLADDHFWGHRD